MPASNGRLAEPHTAALSALLTALLTVLPSARALTPSASSDVKRLLGLLGDKVRGDVCGEWVGHLNVLVPHDHGLDVRLVRGREPVCV